MNRLFLYLRLSAFICVSFLFFSPAQAQTKRPMTPADVIALKAVSNPQISPDGAAVVYVVSVTDTERDRRDSHLWLVRPGQPSRQLTFSAGRDTAPRWSPDGKTIAFLRAGDAPAQIHLLAADGGEAVKLTDEPSGVNSFDWAPDGASIFYLASERAASRARADSRRPEPQVEDEDRPRARLYRITLDGARKTRLATGESHVRSFAVAPDSSAVVFSAAPTSYFNDSPKSELYLLSLREPGAPLQLTRNNWVESGLAWRPDSAGVAFLADADPTFTRRTMQTNFFYYHNGSVRYVALPAQAGPRAGSPGTPEQLEWLDSRNLIVVAANATKQQAFHFNLDTDLVYAVTPGGVLAASVSAAPNARRLAFLAQGAASPNDIWLAEWPTASGPATGSQKAPVDPKAQRLTGHNPQVSEFLLPKMEVVRWKASDGVEVEGILFTSSEGPSERKAPWPLVTRIHGGPASADMASFQAAAYVFTGMGFAVFLPNYRGSTGYGEAFAARSIGDRNGRDARDIEEGIDALIVRGIADPKRLGVMGWSAGGVLTNWLIANNPRYRAASSGAGVADWALQYFLSDYTFGSELYFRGTPWQQHALYWERSPLRLAAQVKTPTLVHSGERDERVPTAHCRAWYRALREHGVTARFVVYPGEPHGLQRPSSQLRRMEEDSAWFQKYLLAP